MRLCDTYTSGTTLEGDIRCERRQSVTRPPEPSISVIVPFHNASAHLERCLQALAGSRHENYELILVDDGSNDSSPEIARQFTDRIITLTSCQGPAVARNRAAEQARGTLNLFKSAAQGRRFDEQYAAEQSTPEARARRKAYAWCK